MFEEFIGRRIGIIYKEGDDIKTTLEVLERINAEKFLRVSTDYNTKLVINSDSIILFYSIIKNN